MRPLDSKWFDFITLYSLRRVNLRCSEQLCHVTHLFILHVGVVCPLSDLSGDQLSRTMKKIDISSTVRMLSPKGRHYKTEQGFGQGPRLFIVICCHVSQNHDFVLVWGVYSVLCVLLFSSPNTQEFET